MHREPPYLNNPAPGWKYDLPAPGDTPEMGLTLLGTEHPINHLDALYLEIPRNTLWIRGVLAWIGLAGVLAVGIGIWIIRSFIFGAPDIPAAMMFFLYLTKAGLIWMCVVLIRLDLFLPRDEPIRFNRARRKVYIYHFRYNWRRPLSKTEWRVEVSVHDWDDLWLEACEVYGSLEYGGTMQGVQLSIQRDRTSDKRYNEIFTHSIRTGEAYWAMIRLFMQQGQHALPKLKNPPRPEEDEEHFFNIFWDCAPKVNWPEDVDIESRSAPDHEHQSEQN